MEKLNKINWIIVLSEFVIALFMMIGIQFIAPVCNGMLELVSGKQVYMKCHYTSVAVFIFAFLLFINAVICIVTKQGMACGIMGAVLSVFIFLLFNDGIGIGICSKAEMACHTTAAFIKICASLSFILWAIVSRREIIKVKRK